MSPLALSEDEVAFLAGLNVNPTFISIVRKLKTMRPELPNYTVDSVTGQDNSAEWQRNSLMADGFNTCLEYLGVKHG